MSYVVTADCTACGACLLTCPEHAIVVGLPLRVREDRCTSCGECVEVCPADAVLEVPADRAARARPGASRGDHAVAAGPASLLSVAGGQQLHDRGRTGARA